MERKMNRIKAVLADKDMKVQDFAKAMNLSREYVSKWINNKSQPSLEQLFKMSDLLDVPVCEFINSKS